MINLGIKIKIMAMNKDLKIASYLFAANFEVVVLILGAWEIAKWLNEHYQKF